jgi:hypothetical protein
METYREKYLQLQQFLHWWQWQPSNLVCKNPARKLKLSILVFGQDFDICIAAGQSIH